MSVLSFLNEVIKPVTGLIDSLHTSDEEKSVLHNELSKIENSFAERVLDYEQQLSRMKADVIMSEAKGESWLQRSWRPITMLTFLGLVVLNTLGLTAVPIADQMWTLLQIGLGGYVVGRSAEKVIPSVVNKFKKG